MSMPVVPIVRPAPMVIALPARAPMQVNALVGQGPGGISAFQDWQIRNPGGTWEEFLASLTSSPPTIMVEFSFGDVPERVMFTLPKAGFMDRLQLVVEVPYNGDTPTLAVRTGSGTMLMNSDENDPTFAATFDSTPQAQLPQGTQIILENSAGFGATAGKGRLLFDLH